MWTDSSPAEFSNDTVLFVGNGVLRVPTWIGLHPQTHGSALTTPSWAEYMESLWTLASKSPTEGRSLLSLRDFSGLSAPRQAEWFDRNYKVGSALSDGDRSALRLHLLGVELHPFAGLLTNDLLLRLGELVTNSALHQRVDIFTTNLDCSLEQNIAWAIEKMLERTNSNASAQIEVMAGFRPSVTWKRDGGAGSPITVRLWKIHGCLRDLKCAMNAASWDRIRSLLQEHPEIGTADGFCGWLPEATRLTPELRNKWRAIGPEIPTVIGSGTAIFSISEYFKSLNNIVQLSRSPSSAAFHQFAEILATRPLLLIGYSLVEEDVDIVYLLQTYRSSRTRIMLVPSRYWDGSAEARIGQMGIQSWKYEVEPIGFCLDPDRLRRAARHEWRTNIGREMELWRLALRRVRDSAWLEPQRKCLDQILANDHSIQPSDLPERRLVFVGLASIWHAFALRRKSDFPVERRVSAGYTSVDAQVPGGSGLVPCMEAAAMAGPQAAGQLSFLTNVPRAWSSWPEIEEFCLSAGVDVRPFLPAEDNPDLQIGRTSYVLLWNLPGHSNEQPLPKQRFIIDVPSLADERRANRLEHLRSPIAEIEADFQTPGREDLLFADKETSIASLQAWNGPLIFETGASGPELLGNDGQLPRPTLWTSGIGSFLRTLIVDTRCLPADKDQFPQSADAVLSILDQQTDLRPFLDCPEETRRRYVAKLVSFELPPWTDEKGVVGFLYEDELAYGQWILDKWWNVAPAALDFLNRRGLLGAPHPVLGQGVLTTIHEGGLMGAWQMLDGSRLLVRVRISPGHAKGASSISHAVTCETRIDTEQGSTTESLAATIDIADKIKLSIDGLSQELPLGATSRWNTLAAGDTVRGAIAYGLWAFVFDCNPKPRDIPHILFASVVLATMKCYAGSFVNYMNLIATLRTLPIWSRLWGFAEGSGRVTVTDLREQD